MGEHHLSLLATVIFAWAVIYGYVAVYSFTLHGYRPGERELRPFAIATGGMMIYTVGSGLVTDATSTAGAVFGFRVVVIGGWIAAAGFMHFAHAVINRPLGGLVRATYVFALIGLVATLSGLTFDVAAAATPHPMLVAGLGPPLVPATNAAYLITSVPALFVIIISAWLMRTPRQDNAERFWLSLAGALLSFAAIHDIAINYLPFRSIYLLEHCYLFCALAMTHHLLGRVARTDDELARRTQQLQESVADLHRTEAELAHKEQLAAVGELSAIIAHEVRAPIAVMQEALTSLRNPADETVRHAQLTSVDRECDRLNHLVGDLLSYAKPLHTQASVVRVSDIVERAIWTVPSSVRDRLEICSTLAPEPRMLECDPELLHQALRNLVDNATAAMAHEGTLSITTSACRHRGSDAISIAISDTGNASEHATDPVAARSAGIGLGLAIVDRVVRAHQGHVEIRSLQPHGTTIILTLPLHPESHTDGIELRTPSMFPTHALPDALSRS